MHNIEINKQKNLICNKFSRAAYTYDALCQVQNNISDMAIVMLQQHGTYFNVVVDMACGTGESTKKILAKLNIKKCFAVDFSAAMLQVAQNKLHNVNVSWLCCDFSMPIVEIKNSDLIFCNMGLQWSNDFIGSLQIWRDYLVQHGMLLYTVPLQDNFPELRTDHRAKFLSHAENMALLQQNGWELLATNLYSEILYFADVVSIFRYLQLTGVNYNKSLDSVRGLRKSNLTDFLNSPDSNTLSYSVGLYLVRQV
jgi:trans-aconitate methyltransferase